MYALTMYRSPFELNEYCLIEFLINEHGIEPQYTLLNYIYNEKIEKILFLCNINLEPFSQATINQCTYSLLEKYEYV